MGAILEGPSSAKGVSLPILPYAQHVLAGIGEISRLHERLSAQRRYNQRAHLLLPLHSAATPVEQRAALAVPKEGIRKVGTKDMLVIV